MMKSEFEAKIADLLVGDQTAPAVSDENYKIIEKVYNFHPSISETEGKKQIAYLYINFGMRVIRDMVPTAEKAEELEDRIRQARMQMETLQRAYSDLKEGIVI